ncbi:MAG: hypothetical protein WBD55_05850 [Dehalococcoidia bacterium]
MSLTALDPVDSVTVTILVDNVPAHCTGLLAPKTLAELFPDALIQNSVGTRYEL